MHMNMRHPSYSRQERGKPNNDLYQNPGISSFEDPPNNQDSEDAAQTDICTEICCVKIGPDNEGSYAHVYKELSVIPRKGKSYCQEILEELELLNEKNGQLKVKLSKRDEYIERLRKQNKELQDQLNIERHLIDLKMEQSRGKIEDIVHCFRRLNEMYSCSVKELSQINGLLKLTQIFPAVKDIAEICRTLKLAGSQYAIYISDYLAEVLEKRFSAKKITPSVGDCFDSRIHERKDISNKGSTITACLVCGWELDGQLVLRAVVETANE